MTTTIMIPAQDLQPGDVLQGDTDTYALNSDVTLPVQRVERIEPDEYSVEETVRIVFGEGHWLCIAATDPVRIVVGGAR